VELQELLGECAKRKASDLHLRRGRARSCVFTVTSRCKDDLEPISHDFVRRTAMTLLGEQRFGMLMEGKEMGSLLQLHREELITYETARDAATNPDDFDLKVKGILSTGEMTWDAGASNAVPPPAVTTSLSHAEAESSPFRKR
jgi:hypothetical protein